MIVRTYLSDGQLRFIVRKWMLTTEYPLAIQLPGNQDEHCTFFLLHNYMIYIVTQIPGYKF